MEIKVEKLIITDLTRFNNDAEVCTAGFDMDTGQCIRPMPYITVTDCERLKIEPGAILTGTFSTINNLTGPHREDMERTELQFVGPCSTEDFKQALEYGLVGSIEEGFELCLPPKCRCIPYTHKLNRSLLSIYVDPKSIHIVEDDGYGKKKLKLRFTDSSGKTFYNVPITDRGFHKQALKHQKEESIDKLNNIINSQEEAILRIGLSRRWQQPQTTNDGYWIQVNGIYTFPEYSHEVRSY